MKIKTIFSHKFAIKQKKKTRNYYNSNPIRLCYKFIISTLQVFGSRIKVDSVAKVAEMELAEKEKMKEKVKKITSHNINVFINRQLIYNYPEQLFADANVMAIEHADFEGIERLALVLGKKYVFFVQK